MWSVKKVKENSRRAKKWNTRGANADERQQEETERGEEEDRLVVQRKRGGKRTKTGSGT